MSFLECQCSDEVFSSFYAIVVSKSDNLTAEPTLSHQRRRPRRHDNDTAASKFNCLEAFYRKQYYETLLDVVVFELKCRFQQERGIPVAVALERILLDSAQGSFNGTVLPRGFNMYSKDVDRCRLLLQLPTLPDLVRSYNSLNPTTPIAQNTNLRSLCDIMNSVTSSMTMLSEIYTLLRLVLTIPVTTSTAERTFPALRRLKHSFAPDTA